MADPIRRLLGSEPLKVHLAGLEYMNDDPSAMHVLYLKVRTRCSRPATPHPTPPHPTPPHHAPPDLTSPGLSLRLARTRTCWQLPPAVLRAMRPTLGCLFSKRHYKAGSALAPVCKLHADVLSVY